MVVHQIFHLANPIAYHHNHCHSKNFFNFYCLRFFDPEVVLRNKYSLICPRVLSLRLRGIIISGNGVRYLVDTISL